MNKALIDLLYAASVGYAVTDDGRVISPKGKSLSFINDNRGYLRFSIRNRLLKSYGKVKVHRLQALRLFGAKLFEEGVVVRHLNGNSYDNRKCNIAIGTQSENCLDAPKDDRRRRGAYAASKRKKLDDEEVAELRRKRASGASYAELMEDYGIAKSTLSYIINRKTYKNTGSGV